jgi:hypothetical protein
MCGGALERVTEFSVFSFRCPVVPATESPECSVFRDSVLSEGEIWNAPLVHRTPKFQKTEHRKLNH